MEGSLVFNTDLNSDLVKELWKSLKGNLLLRTKNWNRRHTVGAWKCNQWIQSIIIIRRWVQYCMKDCLLLLLLLSHFSCVRLCATPETAAHQALPSLGFFRQEHWSGLPFPSPMCENEKWKWSRSVVSDSSRPHGLQPTRLLCPWDFPGKSTGVGCHCLLWGTYIQRTNDQPFKGYTNSWFMWQHGWISRELRWMEKSVPKVSYLGITFT